MAKTVRTRANKARWRAIEKRYGLTEDQWWAIYNEQEGRCFICRRKLKLSGKQTRSSAHTDHCHKTGKVRGILCKRCNMDLVPYFEKNIEAAKNIHKYLTKRKHYGYVPQ